MPARGTAIPLAQVTRLVGVIQSEQQSQLPFPISFTQNYDARHELKEVEGVTSVSVHQAEDGRGMILLVTHVCTTSLENLLESPQADA